ncbi:NADPH:quinone reductase [Cupriavidus necator]|uniref:NADPH:quinone reductase n=1 Tax=Cupriavidus necator TaxID=106590 RepID=UPI002786F8D6|nr:NADPH:quinone reductase [Cupriavidus necator]MDQ0141258.1 NADPH2:quinone reductase [Cupriavidus necator]
MATFDPRTGEIMRAAWYSRNGEAGKVLEFGELPTPTPGPGEVRVRLATSGVNPSDVKSRQGRPLASERVVPHSDGAGVIDAVGTGVAQARIGERVWIWNGQWQRPMGTAAQYIALPQAQAVPLPANTDFAAAACLGIPAMTAFQAIHLLGDIAGKTVLVIGASSAVGHYVVQLAVCAGATVIGTVGSTQKAHHAMAAGAQATIDYKQEPVAQAVMAQTGGKGVHAIVDMDFSTTVQLLPQGVLRPHGTLVSYGSNAYGDIPVPFRDLLFSSASLRFFLVYDLCRADRERAVGGLTRLMEDGRLTHAIGARFPLQAIAQAHEAVEGGKLIGNVILDIPPE